MQIYLIRNTVNGKVYVGQTRLLLKRRWGGHKNAANRGNGAYLYQSMRKHGWDKFEVLPLFHAFSAEYLDDLERYFISLFRSNEGQFGYNATSGGLSQGTPTQAAIEKNRLAHLGRKSSPETREKIRRAITGKRWSEEARARWKGHKKSEETRRRMGAARLGKSNPRRRPVTDEFRRRMSEVAKIRESKIDRRGPNNPNFGRKFSAETRKKISDAHRGQIAWNKGKCGLIKMSAETKEKIRAALLAHWSRS
jgi:group I intron endonuclease